MVAKVQSMLMLLLVTMLVTGTLAAPTGNSNDSCTLEFQRKFQELMSFKKTCQYTHLRDCCQVANGVQMFGEASSTNVLYPINDVCAKDLRTFRNTDNSSPQTLQARCDLKDGWLVILRRKSDVSPLVNFNRSWVEYENGFGDLNTEFWYGLKNIHCLTQRDDMELMIELKQNDGSGKTWTYQTFRVDAPDTNYVLYIGGAEEIEGSTVDYMAYHNGLPFTTFDNDNDGRGGNCATSQGGGWWYNTCYNCVFTRPHSLNNVYHPSTGYLYFPHVEMKIRPKSCLVTYKQSESCE